MQKRFNIPAIVIGGVFLTYIVAETYRDRDHLEYFVDLKRPLVASQENTLEDHPDYQLIQVDLRDDNGLEVVGYLKRPTKGAGPFPVILALGGIRTGKDVVNYLDDTPNVMILALDYPYKGKKSKLGVWEFISKTPAIRRALFNTVPASMLAVDYLLERDDVDASRIIFVGGSVGAMYGPIVGAADSRIAAVAILFGSGDLQAVFRANIKAPAPLAAVGSWIVSVLVSPLEPLKYVGRISPRPLLMLNGTGDPRMPIESSRLLHEEAGEPKTIRWIDAGHVDIRSREFHALVRNEIVGWLAAHDLVATSDSH